MSRLTRDLPAAQDYFELGVILLRKKLYTQATKNLEKAKKAWTGEPEELAQVRSRAQVLGSRALHPCNREIGEGQEGVDG